MTSLLLKFNLLKMLLLCIFSGIFLISSSQQPVGEKSITLSENSPDAVNRKTNRLETKMNDKIEKYLEQMQQQEQRLKRKLAKVNSVKAEELFG